MSTKVEQLVADSGNTAKVILALIHFLDLPNNEALLRIALISIIPTTGSDKNWKFLIDKFEELFPQKKYQIKQYNNESIRRYLLGIHEPRNAEFKAYLLLLFLNEMEKHQIHKNNKTIRNTDMITTLCDRAEKFLELKSTNELLEAEAKIGVAQAISNMGTTLKHAVDDRKIAEFLFNDVLTDDIGQLDDCSYYVVYRYSTTKGQVMKTFLSIQSPRASKTHCFSFTHVYPLQIRERTRVSRGPLLCFEQCIYFLGGAANQIRGITQRNQGLKQIAVPIGGTNTHHLLLSGVFMSHNFAWQPIVGRAVLVHLGFRSKIGKVISDADAGIKEIPNIDDLSGDIDELNKKFDLSNSISVAEIYKYITQQANNIPSVDRNDKDEFIGCRAVGVEDGREPLA